MAVNIKKVKSSQVEVMLSSNVSAFIPPGRESTPSSAPGTQGPKTRREKRHSNSKCYCTAQADVKELTCENVTRWEHTGG